MFILGGWVRLRVVCPSKSAVSIKREFTAYYLHLLFKLYFVSKNQRRGTRGGVKFELKFVHTLKLLVVMLLLVTQSHPQFGTFA